MFIYLITNLINGKRYIGQTKQSLSARWNMHVSKNHCRYLYNAIQKHGRENFSMEVLFDVPTKELANEFEIEYIKRYCTLFPNGYNILPGGDDRPPLTEKQRQAISKLHKGNKYRVGHVPSEETKRKLSLANTGKKMTHEQRQKLSAAMKGNKNPSGRHVSEETRRKIGSAHKGKILSKETKQQLSIAHSGKKATEETRENMRLAQQKRRLNESPEDRKRMPLSEEVKHRMKLSQMARRSRERNV